MYPRNLTSDILNKLNNKEVIFLLGTRQTGRTTLTKLVSEASEFEKKYSKVFSGIQKRVINQSYFNFESDIKYIPAYLI